MRRGVLVLAIVFAGTVARARADVDYFKAAQKPTTVTYHVGNDRPERTRWLIGGLGGAAGLSLLAGAYFNFEAHDAATKVSAHTLTGKVWSDDLQGDYDRIHSSNVKAIVGYSLAGAFAIATIVVVLKSDPGETDVEVDPTKPTAMIAPTPGGAIVGASWGF
ncbi:MAG TPA: hypothetical protein VL463_19330 [Kofleriaceae bacterium]|nr:hypothetical protein [Kofleriaceae bacterium]